MTIRIVKPVYTELHRVWADRTEPKCSRNTHCKWVSRERDGSDQKGVNLMILVRHSADQLLRGVARILRRDDLTPRMRRWTIPDFRISVLIRNFWDQSHRPGHLYVVVSLRLQRSLVEGGMAMISENWRRKQPINPNLVQELGNCLGW